MNTYLIRKIVGITSVLAVIVFAVLVGMSVQRPDASAGAAAETTPDATEIDTETVLAPQTLEVEYTNSPASTDQSTGATDTSPVVTTEAPSTEESPAEAPVSSGDAEAPSSEGSADAGSEAVEAEAEEPAAETVEPEAGAEEAPESDVDEAAEPEVEADDDASSDEPAGDEPAGEAAPVFTFEPPTITVPAALLDDLVIEPAEDIEHFCDTHPELCNPDIPVIPTPNPIPIPTPCELIDCPPTIAELDFDVPMFDSGILEAGTFYAGLFDSLYPPIPMP